MNQKLLASVKKPEPFTRSEKMFWTDPHIATHLLEAHLSQATEGASRNQAFIERSVAFLCHEVLTNETKAIIDYGCGPGFYCEAFAKRGYQVTGVDFSANSIAYAKSQAKKKQLPITYEIQNYLEEMENKKYDFATLIYCDYGALSASDRKQFLSNCWHRLKEGGRLFLDVFTDLKYDTFTESRSWHLHEQGGFWSEREHLELAQNVKYSDLVTLEQSVIVTEDDVDTYYIWNKFFTRDRFVNELAAAGFKLIAVYNNAAGQAFNGKAETMAVVVEKK